MNTVDYLAQVEADFVEKLTHVVDTDLGGIRTWKHEEGNWNSTHILFCKAIKEVAETVQTEVRQEYRKKLMKIVLEGDGEKVIDEEEVQQ